MIDGPREGVGSTLGDHFTTANLPGGTVMPLHSTDLSACGQSQTKIFIYALIDPFTDEYRYVGKTDNPPERLKNHCNDKKRCYRTNWIQSLIKRGKKPRMVILQVVPPWASWQDCERMWIDHGVWNFWPLTNSTSGGDGTSGMDAACREKISKAMKGRKLSPEHRAIAVANLKPGRTWDEDERRRKSIAMTGRSVGTETRRKISASKRKLNDDQLSEIEAMLASGKSQSLVARTFGVSQSTISGIVNRRKKYLQATTEGGGQ